MNHPNKPSNWQVRWSALLMAIVLVMTPWLTSGCVGASAPLLAPPLGAGVTAKIAPQPGAPTASSGLGDAAKEPPAELTALEWRQITQQIHQHAYHAMAGEQPNHYHASNRAHGWQLAFDEDGFLMQPQTGGWQWGLRLRQIGHVNAMQPVAIPTVSAQKEIVRLAWTPWLTEEYINSEQGVKQNFVLTHRPQSDRNEAPLRLEMEVIGGLTGRLTDKSVSFIDAKGATVVTYQALRVYDTLGREMPAWFTLVGAHLSILVQDAQARYPLTIDPLVQQAYFKASNAETSDSFGTSISMSGDTVVIGARVERSAATGVNGNQNDNSAPESGAAYVFVRSSAQGAPIWSQQAYLKASNTDQEDRFGGAVAISGNTIVVGAIGESSSAAGVNGKQSDNSLPESGAAYVFVRNGTTWSQQAYLKASNPGSNAQGAGDLFGTSVAVAGDTIVVGAVNEASDATGVNGNQNDNSADSAGAAYVFVRSGTTWSQQAYLKASNTEAFDNFGWSVAAADNTIVVGAIGESSAAAGVNGKQNDNSAGFAGAAYVFVRSGATWSQQAYLKASNPEFADNFGRSIALDNNTIVVGAHVEDSNTRGSNGDQNNNSAPESGAAYVFVRNSTTWSQQAYLKASNTRLEDHFGFSVALAGDMLVVGADGEDSAATGINGDQNDTSDPEAGAAYVFVRNGTSWSQSAYLKASNTPFNGFFGTSVAVAGNTIVVGSIGEDSNATSVNGDQNNNLAPDSGAVYVFADVVSQPVLFVSSNDGSTVGGVTFADEDILAFNLTTNAWSLYLDGSDVISRSNDIDAFSLLDDGNILMSFNVTRTMTGLGEVTPNDIVTFLPTSLGAQTRGSFAIFLDGSDVGLTGTAEDIDAVSLTADGKLVVSTRGSFSVPGLTGQDEDLLILDNAVFGPNSSGTWRLYFDGSDVSLGSSGEDIKGTWINPNANQIYLATENTYSVPGLTGGPGDVFICTHTSLGSTTSCTFSRFWDGAAFGFGSQHVDGLEVGDSSQLATVSSASDGDEQIPSQDEDGADPEPADEQETQRVFLPSVSR